MGACCRPPAGWVEIGTNHMSGYLSVSLILTYMVPCCSLLALPSYVDPLIWASQRRHQMRRHGLPVARAPPMPMAMHAQLCMALQGLARL
jgi:hypothetical protein